MASLARLLAVALALFGAAALACEVPYEEGASPLRRVVARVKLLPVTEEWLLSLPKGTTPQFMLLLDSPQKIRGLCYWPVEARAGNVLWRRFLVTADGENVLPDPPAR